jgi:hypothetical protein
LGNIAPRGEELFIYFEIFEDIKPELDVLRLWDIKIEQWRCYVVYRFSA